MSYPLDHPQGGWARQAQHREIAIDTVPQAYKTARGTKRVCQACEVRFYDLARDPIVCPACGAQNTAEVRPVVAWEARGASSGGKATWRSKPFKRPRPSLPVEQDPAPDIPADAAEEASGSAPDNDLVLEQEADEGDVTEWVDRDAVKGKDP